MEQLGAFFQFLSEFHSKAIEERLQREDEARRQEAQRKKAEEDAAARQGQAAVEEAERNKVEKLQKLRALVEGGGSRETAAGKTSVRRWECQCVRCVGRGGAFC